MITRRGGTLCDVGHRAILTSGARYGRGADRHGGGVNEQEWFVGRGPQRLIGARPLLTGKATQSAASSLRVRRARPK